MPKVPLNTITSGYGTVDALNQNFDAIEAAFDNTLSRNGDTPNQMSANLDMNGFSIINQKNAITVEGFNWEGPWLTATSYQVGDTVQESGSAYICVVAHTSGVFATDLAASRWQLVAQANLPTQTGNSGKYLTTNGALASWDNVQFTALGSGAVQRTITSKAQEIISVKDFGAVGDGVTDDTIAINNAYNAACATKATLFFPSGNYICSGLDLGGAAHKGCTFEGMSFDGRGNGYLSSRITLKPGSNRPLFTLLAGDAPHSVFRYLLLDGNALQQTANEYVIKTNNDLVTAYPYGIFMEDCQIVNGRGGGVYLGQRRGYNLIRNCYFYNNGEGNSGHGIYCDTYDVVIDNVHIGNSFGYGLYLNSGSQLQFTNVNSYFNVTGGLYIGAGVTDLMWCNGSIDRNLRYGVYSVKRTSTAYPGRRSFVNVRWLGNSQNFNNIFPDVYIDNDDTDLVFIGCMFMGFEGANKPNYAFQLGNLNSRVKILGCSFDNNRPGWATAVANDFSLIDSADFVNHGFYVRSDNDGLTLRLNNVDGPSFLNPTGATSNWLISGDTGGFPYIIPRGNAANINASVSPKGTTGQLVLKGGSGASKVIVSDTGVAFQGNSPISKPTVTGSRGGNAALTSLLTALSNYGLITDSST